MTSTFFSSFKYPFVSEAWWTRSTCPNFSPVPSSAAAPTSDCRGRCRRARGQPCGGRSDGNQGSRSRRRGDWMHLAWGRLDVPGWVIPKGSTLSGNGVVKLWDGMAGSGDGD